MRVSKNEQKPELRLKPLQAAVLEFIATINRPTAKKVADNFGVSLRTAKRVIAFLKTNGYIGRTGNNRSGGYIILEREEN